MSGDTYRQAHRNGIRQVPALVIALVWLGLLIGVSFLATPVKFQAPSLDLPTALEVGRATFGLFNPIEWGLVASLGIAGLIARQKEIWTWGIWIALVGLLVVQSAWLLPVLDARIEHILAGNSVPASFHHQLYIGIELTKAALLLASAVVTLSRLARTQEATECD